MNRPLPFAFAASAPFARRLGLAMLLSLSLAFVDCTANAGGPDHPPSEQKTRAFLEKHRGSWRALNVPYRDGQALYKLIVERRFTRGLEIGTSTGHSTIWIAMAMRRTGGRVTTIELDPKRHAQAQANFREAGVSDLIDARLGDAHVLVPAQPGPFDFVFSDADKDWYTQYFRDVHPKLVPGGCHVAHNVNDGFAGVERFLEYVRARSDYETKIVNPHGSGGLGVSCRKTGKS